MGTNPPKGTFESMIFLFQCWDLLLLVTVTLEKITTNSWTNLSSKASKPPAPLQKIALISLTRNPAKPWVGHRPGGLGGLFGHKLIWNCQWILHPEAFVRDLEVNLTSTFLWHIPRDIQSYICLLSFGGVFLKRMFFGIQIPYLRMWPWMSRVGNHCNWKKIVWIFPTWSHMKDTFFSNICSHWRWWNYHQKRTCFSTNSRYNAITFGNVALLQDFLRSIAVHEKRFGTENTTTRWFSQKSRESHALHCYTPKV